MKKQDHGQETVYFLGAGASHASDFKLPLMNGFFREEDFTVEKYPAFYKFMQDIFPKVPIPNLNLEEVVSYLELSIDKFGAFGKQLNPYLFKAKREFDKYVDRRLSYKPIEGRYWCYRHKILFENLGERDTVISLNYDLIVDHTFFEISPKNDLGNLKDGCLLDRMYSLLGKTQVWGGELPSLRHKDTKLGHYLKLHGSIDWLYCPNQTCGNHQLFFPNWMGLPQTHNQPGNLCILCGSPLVSVIIPPTLHKSFENFPKLGLLWSLAYRGIASCNRLVIIGVSLTESDYYLKWLITSAISAQKTKPKIIVVNKDKEVCSKIEKLIGYSPVYSSDFCEYIHSIKKE